MANDVVVQMQNAFKDLNATFDTEPGTEIVPRPPRELVVAPVITHDVGSEERHNDMAVVRETLHRIMSKSEDALDDLLALAKQSEHPRAFEVAGQMIKNVSDVATQLMDMHKKIKELDKVTENPREAALNGAANIDTQNNIVFTGTAEDLLDAMAARREKNAGAVVVIENS